MTPPKSNPENEKEVLELLKIWFYLKVNQVIWPDAIKALESRINELLEMPLDEWQHAIVGPPHQ